MKTFFKFAIIEFLFQRANHVCHQNFPAEMGNAYLPISDVVAHHNAQTAQTKEGVLVRHFLVMVSEIIALKIIVFFLNDAVCMKIIPTPHTLLRLRFNSL